MACCSSALWHFSLCRLPGQLPGLELSFYHQCNLEIEEVFPLDFSRLPELLFVQSQLTPLTFLTWCMSLRGGNQCRGAGERETQKGSLQSGVCEKAGNHHGQLEHNPRETFRKHVEHMPLTYLMEKWRSQCIYTHQVPSVLMESYSQAFISWHFLPAMWTHRGLQ